MSRFDRQLEAEPPPDPNRALRWGVYLLLIAIATGGALGRIMAVNSVDVVRLEKYLKDQGRDDWQKQRPFLSSNDRSRWATIRALVEHGTYAIDDIINQPNWDTIDIVKHDGQGNAAPQPDRGHIYSSKPTLLPTLMAGQYWLIHKATGATLGTHPYEIGRAMLVTWNVLPLIVYFLVLARLVDRYGRTDWGRVFVMAAATAGMFLATFAVVLNNHLTAAVCAVIALDAAIRIWYEERRQWRWFIIAGLFAALTATNELPALAFFAAVTVALLWKAPRQTLLVYLPSAAVVLAAALATNYAAHQTLLPAYAHRGKDSVLASLGLPAVSKENNWYEFQFRRGDRVIDSYWSSQGAKSPVDQGEPSAAAYVLHALVGHHGIFSLSPVWLLSVVGLAIAVGSRTANLRAVCVMILLVSAVCLAFYLTREQQDRNYGGMSSGFRWVFWFAPLWLLAMLPAADLFSRRGWLQVIAAVLLAASVLSVSYPTWNPWVHPWLLDWMLYNNWVGLGNPTPP